MAQEVGVCCACEISTRTAATQTNTRILLDNGTCQCQSVTQAASVCLEHSKSSIATALTRLMDLLTWNGFVRLHTGQGASLLTKIGGSRFRRG